jgi:hypothetical protein
MVFRVRV